MTTPVGAGLERVLVMRGPPERVVITAPGARGDRGTAGVDGLPGAGGPAGPVGVSTGTAVARFGGTGPPPAFIAGSNPQDLYLDYASGVLYRLD